MPVLYNDSLKTKKDYLTFNFFLLEKINFTFYNQNPGCDMRGVSGALLPEIRFMRGRIPFQGFKTDKQIILIGRHATDDYEPRQVRKEAAISNSVCVVDRSRLCYNLFFVKTRQRVHNQDFFPLKLSLTFFFFVLFFC